MRTRSILVGLTAAAAVASPLALATSAHGAVTVNPETGIGFVGKGDVQTVFGWNNPTLQKNASGVTFTYNSTATYAQDCYKVVGGERNPQRVEVTFKKSQVVNAKIGDSQRTNSSGLNGPNTGWFLTGFGATTGSTTAPESICNPADGGNNSEDSNGFIADGPVQETSSTGGLFVNYGGTSVALPNTPVVAPAA